jgi:hypothetical protein
VVNEPVEASLDETVTWRTIAGIWFCSAAISIVAYVGVVVFVGMVARSAILALTLGLIIATTVFWLVFLLSTRQEAVGEWRVLLDDRAPVAGSVYSLVCGELRDRHMPISAVVHRTRTGFGAVSNRLILIDGHYKVCVSVFEYGTSLYLGWMMWRSRRGWTLLGRFVSDLVAGITGRLDPVGMTLRTERARAMREAAHAICREGLRVAIERREVPVDYGFPNGLPPIEEPPGFQQPPPPP